MRVRSTRTTEKMVSHYQLQKWYCITRRQCGPSPSGSLSTQRQTSEPRVHRRSSKDRAGTQRNLGSGQIEAEHHPDFRLTSQ
jgi:hypothetical protein